MNATPQTAPASVPHGGSHDWRPDFPPPGCDSWEDYDADPFDSDDEPPSPEVMEQMREYFERHAYTIIARDAAEQTVIERSTGPSMAEPLTELQAELWTTSLRRAQVGATKLYREALMLTAGELNLEIGDYLCERGFDYDGIAREAKAFGYNPDVWQSDRNRRSREKRREAKVTRAMTAVAARAMAHKHHTVAPAVDSGPSQAATAAHEVAPIPPIPFWQMTADEFSLFLPEQIYEQGHELCSQVWSGSEFHERAKTAEGRRQIHRVALRHTFNADASSLSDDVLRSHALDPLSHDAHCFFSRELWKRQQPSIPQPVTVPAVSHEDLSVAPETAPCEPLQAPETAPHDVVEATHEATDRIPAIEAQVSEPLPPDYQAMAKRLAAEIIVAKPGKRRKVERSLRWQLARIGQHEPREWWRRTELALRAKLREPLPHDNQKPAA